MADETDEMIKQLNLLKPEVYSSIQCDSCDHVEDNKHHTGRHFPTWLYQEGWRVIDGIVHCSECLKGMNDE
jgi:hypothetical protein